VTAKLTRAVACRGTPPRAGRLLGRRRFAWTREDLRAGRIVVGIGAIGLIAAAAGTTFWTFIDPSTSGAPFALYIGGIAICYLAVLGASIAVRPVKHLEADRSTP
jgi:hypothetical protein